MSLAGSRLEGYIGAGYSSYMAGLALKTAGGCQVLVLVLSSLAGLVCADSDDMQAMECCRGDAHHCNMPEKTEDCCKPDRTSQNPASLESSFRSSVDVQRAPGAAVVAPVVTAPDAGYRVIPFSSSRGSPPLLANQPIDIPLLN